MTEEIRMVARTALVLFVALVLQVGLFDELRVFSVHPELLLAVGIATAVAWGPERGVVVCFVAGLLADLILSGRFGVTALAWGVAGYGVGRLSDAVARRSHFIDAGLMALGSAAAVMLYAVVAALFGESTLGDDHLWRIIGIVTAWNVLLSPIVLPVARWAGREPELRPVR
ncbi:MAG: rod shape-determining protein MreD [Actinomycetia bacterium]|nr:rod shape-determining protein MreD [Actinomycetes bacterium]